MRRPLAENGAPRVYVPLTVAVAKLCEAPRVITLPVPVKVTVEEVAVNEVAEAVFHDPAMPIAADAKVMVATPLEVRSPLKVAVALVRVRVPVNVRADATVVLIPVLTVRLEIVVGMFTEPPDALTTIVDVPAVNVPAEVLILWTVMELPLATRMPPDPIVMVVALMGRPDAEVPSEVVPDPSLTWRVVTFKPRVASVNVWPEAAEDMNATVANSGPLRFVPAKVIVPPVAEVKVTVAVPALQDALVDALLQVPATVHASEPKAM